MTERPLAERIRAYYDETWGDYRWRWLSPRNYAIHLSYWDETTRTHAQSQRGMNRALADRIGVQPSQCVLDAGCGVGGSARWLARERGVEIAINDIRSNVLPSLRRLHWRTQALRVPASLVRRMGMRSETQQGNTRGAHEFYRAVRRGLWREQILTATAR